MKKDKKNFYSKLKMWENNRDAIIEMEADYKQLIIEKYNIYLEKLKIDFKNYAELYNFNITERDSFIDARFSDLILRFEFIKPNATEYYKIPLIIKDISRKEYFIIIRPKFADIYIPSLSKTAQRPKPKTLDEAIDFINPLEEESIFIFDKTNELRNMDFVYCYYLSSNKNPEINNMKTYKSFLEIIDKLL